MDINNNTLDSRYTKEKLLGNGSFGFVYRVVDKITNEILCKKVVQVSNQNDLNTAMNEVDVLRQMMDHPFIISYKNEYVLDELNLNIIMEYAPKGDLHSMVSLYRKKDRVLSQDKILRWFVQIVLAINFVHSKGIIHRDIKLKNILMVDDRNIKLADFGVSKIMAANKDASTFIGSPHYMSPEICKKQRYNYKTDIWSLGVVLFELMARKHPFSGPDVLSIMNKIIDGKYPEITEDCYHEDLHALVEQLLSVEPEHRPSTIEILENKIIKEYLDKDKELSTIVNNLTINNRGPNECTLNSKLLKSFNKNETLELVLAESFIPDGLTDKSSNSSSDGSNEKKLIESTDENERKEFLEICDLFIDIENTNLKVYSKLGISEDLQQFSRAYEIEYIRSYLEDIASNADYSDCQNYLKLRKYLFISQNKK